jgi:hypothetical protein
VATGHHHSYNMLSSAIFFRNRTKLLSYPCDINIIFVVNSCCPYTCDIIIIFVFNMPNDRILFEDLRMPIVSMLMCYITHAGTRMTNNQAHTTKCRANKLAWTQKLGEMTSRSS